MNNRVRNHLWILAVATAIAVALVPSALASPSAVLQDCKDGSLDSSHSDADKRAALGQMPADLDEYSDCRAIINAAIGRGGKPDAGSGGNGAPDGAVAAPQARKADARKATKARAARLRRDRHVRDKELGPRAVDPRDASVFRAANTANGMPLPLTLALIMLALIALAGGVLTLWRRHPAFADAIRRVTPPRLRR